VSSSQSGVGRQVRCGSGGDRGAGYFPTGTAAIELVRWGAVLALFRLGDGIAECNMNDPDMERF
jgi:hypothetical protein